MCNCLDYWWEDDERQEAPELANVTDDTFKPLYHAPQIVMVNKKTGARVRNSGVFARFCPWCGEPYRPT